MSFRVLRLTTTAGETTGRLQANVPSVRMVKGESPSLLAENCPPRDVIRKQRLKKPIPTTNILQHRGRREGTEGKGGLGRQTCLIWNGDKSMF